MWPSILGTIPQWIGAIIASIALFIAWKQLSNVVKNNSIKIILDIEKELHDRKSKIDDLSSKIRQNESNNALIAIFHDDLLAAKESYFNALDRLCYCILQGYLKDREWKNEYSSLLTDTVRSNRKEFQTGTYYINIVKIYKKWVEEK